MKTISLTNNNIEQINKEFAVKTAAERLAFLFTLSQENIVFSTSFGLEDQILTHLISSANLPVKFITLDTGRLFQETYNVFELTRVRYKIAVHVYVPDKDELEEFVNANGINSFYQSVEQRKLCCKIRKVNPLNLALKGAAVWITGLRAAQSEAREKLQFLELDAERGLLKCNPLLDWRLEQAETFAAENKIPLNTLHAKGFPSIGCAPCTRAIEPGEDIRAGRWWWENSKKECGLHSA
jgi:phosphoadenosine phosphosulfate reductase